MTMITASAPGKILLIGGYSVLERPNVSYVLAVDAYVHAKIKLRKDDKIVISVPQFKTKIKSDLIKIHDENNESVKFVLNAVKTTLKYLGYRKISVTGFNLTTKSDKQFSVEGGKSGLGSSAAVTVATVAAISEAFGLNIKNNIDRVHSVAQYVHAISQGKIGSGFDIAAACFGTINYSRYDPERLTLAEPTILLGVNLDYNARKVSLPPLFKLLAASFPKQSMSTTFSVKKVMEFKNINPNEYANIINNLNESNVNAISAIENNSMDLFRTNFEEGRLLTKKLGELSGVAIETNEHTRLIEESKQNGAFVCKLPGAGGGDSIVALCKSKDDKEKLEKFWKKNGLKILNVGIVNQGVQIK